MSKPETNPVRNYLLFAGSIVAVAAMATMVLGDDSLDIGSMPATFLAAPAATGDIPAGFLGKDAGEQPAGNGFVQYMLDTSWDFSLIGTAHAECNCQGGPANPGSHPAGGNGGIFGAVDRSVDQLIATYQTGTIGRAVAQAWRDMFQRGNLYNPSRPGNIPGLFLAGEPTGPGRISASFLSGTVSPRPSGYVAESLTGGGWDGKGFGHWSW